MLCGDLGGRDGGGAAERLKRGGTHVYVGLIQFALQQKRAQHYKAIILQFKKKKQHKGINFTVS